MSERDWRFGGAIETYKERIGTKGLAEYVAMLERLSAAKRSRGPLSIPTGVARRWWPDRYVIQPPHGGVAG